MISAENGILQRAATEKEVCLKTAEQLCFAVILRSENILTYFLSKINIRTGVFQMTASYPERVFLHVTETVSTNDDVKKMIYSGDDRFALLSADTQSRPLDKGRRRFSAGSRTVDGFRRRKPCGKS